MKTSFLPITAKEVQERGWQEVDIVIISGDAYVDHPSFGHAIISRVLENAGYSVGIISQPDWKNPKSIDTLGRPRLGFLVSGGNMDSMVNHYSVTKHRRKTDAFTPGGEMGKRPDYATTVYGNLIRQTYKDAPIIIGGIEASLRRLSHYDYWSETMKRSILLDSQADILMYGMGNGADKIIAVLESYGIKYDDVFASDGFVRGHFFHGKRVLSYSEVKEKYGAENIIILLSFGSSLPSVLSLIKAVNAECELYAPDVPVCGESLFTLKFFEENQEKILNELNFCNEKIPTRFRAKFSCGRNKYFATD